MNEFEKNLNSDEESEARNIDSSSENQSDVTASVEMTSNPMAQENTPSQAQAEIEVSDDFKSSDYTAEAQSNSSYSYHGSALGSNAVDSFKKSTEPAEPQNNTKRYAENTYSNYSGGYQSVPYSNEAYMNGVNAAKAKANSSIPYREHIKEHDRNRKSDKRPKRYIAAMLAAAMLNLAVLGGAFALGHSFGSKDGAATNKESLSQSLRSNDSSPVSSSSANGTTNTAATTGDKTTTEIAKEVGPAVVGIKSRIQGQISLFGGYTESESQGSGIIISEDGYIVTNNHVVDGASEVTVLLNTGSEYTANVIGTDEQTDLAVIKIQPGEDLTVAVLGDSSKVEVGETAIAIGNPMGVDFFGSVTQGIVSAVNRTVEVENRTMNLIQTDAAINSGNSGGALINSRGEVIGINTVKVSTTGVEGMGFAIPISEAKPIISDLLDYGYVKGRPIIGVSTRDVSSYMAQQYGWPQGAQIMSVTTDNARNAGLQQGDIITSADGTKISSGSDLTEYKDTKSPGDTVELEVYKYATGKTEKIKVVLSEQIPD